MAQRFGIRHTREWFATETGAPDPPAAAASAAAATAAAAAASHPALSRHISSPHGSASASVRGKWESRRSFSAQTSAARSGMGETLRDDPPLV